MFLSRLRRGVVESNLTLFVVSSTPSSTFILNFFCVWIKIPLIPSNELYACLIRWGEIGWMANDSVDSIQFRERLGNQPECFLYQDGCRLICKRFQAFINCRLTVQRWRKTTAERRTQNYYTLITLHSPSLFFLCSRLLFRYSWHWTYNNSMNIFGDKFISLSYEKINFIYYLLLLLLLLSSQHFDLSKCLVMMTMVFIWEASWFLFHLLLMFFLLFSSQNEFFQF